MPAALGEALSLDDIRSSFAFFDDWEDRYRFLIDLGRSVPALPARQRIDGNLVRGCQSQVWLVPHYDAVADRLHLAIDSDAHIVRGLIAVVLAAFDGQSPRAIAGFDIDGLFEDLALLRHLTPTRGNGLRAMVGRIRAVAEQHEEPPENRTKKSPTPAAKGC